MFGNPQFFAGLQNGGNPMQDQQPMPMQGQAMMPGMSPAGNNMPPQVMQQMQQRWPGMGQGRHFGGGGYFRGLMDGQPQAGNLMGQGVRPGGY